MELIVGRQDGRLELYNNGNSQLALGGGFLPNKSFSRDLNECIRSLECGKVNSTDYNEIVVE